MLGLRGVWHTPSHVYSAEAFPELYQKAYNDLIFLDKSFLQILRKRYLTCILRAYHQPFSLSRFLERVFLHVFHIPRVHRKPQGLRMLDVGCGFGEFMSIYAKLGSEVTGT